MFPGSPQGYQRLTSDIRLGSGLFSITVVRKHHGQKQLQEEKVFFWLIHTKPSPLLEVSAGNSSGSRSMNHERKLLTGLLLVVTSACFLIQPRRVGEERMNDE